MASQFWKVNDTYKFDTTCLLNLCYKAGHNSHYGVPPGICIIHTINSKYYNKTYMLLQLSNIVWAECAVRLYKWYSRDTYVWTYPLAQLTTLHGCKYSYITHK